jgi:hypothetical protein
MSCIGFVTKYLKGFLLLSYENHTQEKPRQLIEVTAQLTKIPTIAYNFSNKNT